MITDKKSLIRQFNLFLAILFFSPFCLADAITPLINVKIEGVTYAVRKFATRNSSDHFWGEYVNNNEVVKERLHLFPNKKFLVTWQCDLCTQVTVSEGTFEYRNGQLLLAHKPGGRPMMLAPRFVFHGYAVEGNNSENRYAVILLDQSNYEAALQKNSPYKFLHRVDSYNPWEKIYKELKSRRLSPGARFPFF